MADPVMTGHMYRQVEGKDLGRVLALVNGDWITGQPRVTREMLADALAGRSDIDSGWWAELSDLVTEVAVTTTGRIAGAISYATRARDNAGIILWLHAGEYPAVVESLVNRALSQMSARSVVEAFSFASALGLGLEALPVRHRKVTHDVLSRRGFAHDDLWRYMHRLLPASLPTTSYRTVAEDDTRKLQVVEGGQVAAEATVGAPVHGIGVLWWIGVEPQARGHGLGRMLLGSALELLTGLGAREVILYVDDDEPGGDRDRAAANQLYDSAGFTEVDRLYSYRLDRARS